MLAVAGDTTIDSIVLLTVMLKNLVMLLPARSVIVRLSFVVPCGKVDPLGSPCVSDTLLMPLSESAAAGSKNTTAPALDVACTDWLLRFAAEGLVLSSLIVTV